MCHVVGKPCMLAGVILDNHKPLCVWTGFLPGDAVYLISDQISVCRRGFESSFCWLRGFAQDSLGRMPWKINQKILEATLSPNLRGTPCRPGLDILPSKKDTGWVSFLAGALRLVGDSARVCFGCTGCSKSVAIGRHSLGLVSGDPRLGPRVFLLWAVGSADSGYSLLLPFNSKRRPLFHGHIPLQTPKQTQQLGRQFLMRHHQNLALKEFMQDHAKQLCLFF